MPEESQIEGGIWVAVETPLPILAKTKKNKPKNTKNEQSKCHRPAADTPTTQRSIATVMKCLTNPRPRR